MPGPVGPSTRTPVERLSRTVEFSEEQSRPLPTHVLLTTVQTSSIHYCEKAAVTLPTNTFTPTLSLMS